MKSIQNISKENANNKILKNKIIKVFFIINLLIILLLPFSFTQNQMQITNAYATEYYFAQVQNQNVYLYDKPYGTPIFEIPETYYVKLTQKSENGHYKAEYLNVSGYVLISDIQCVANEPATPYLNGISFRNYGTQSSELRSEPSRLGGASTLICELPLYETNFTYYGEISGEEVVPNRGDIWYYCEYTKNNQTKLGYIYAGLVDMKTAQISNPIDPYPVLKHEWKTEEISQTTTNPTISLPDNKQTLIILAISVPILIILALMFKPAPKQKESNLNKNANKNTTRPTFQHPNLEQPRYASCNNFASFQEKARNNYNSTQYQTSLKPNRKNKKGKDYYEL